MTAKNIRLIVAGVVSVYGIVGSVDHAPGVHLSAAVAAVLAAAGPVMLGLQHWLSDPSTGNTAPPAPPTTGPGVPLAVPATPVEPVVDDVTAGRATAAPAPVASPAPVPPDEWSTLSGAAPAPVAPPAPGTPNPAPPAPAA